jgi:Phosphomannose isomerase
MLYPLKFKPILKPIIWGGDKVCKFKNIEPLRDEIGESWEISDVEGDVSIVANGKLKGKTLDELIESYPEELAGSKIIERFGKTFPLLIKFIDAKEALSIQVHPNDDLAKEKHNSLGKTEMWYVVEASETAYLYSGFSRDITPEQYVQSVKDNNFVDYLQRYDVKPGDAFYLPAGRVHTIGAGCFIAEIQQTSNITYRIYDYNRKDSNDNPRELHTKLAKDAIDYKVYPDYKLQYDPNGQKVQKLIECPYFTTTLINAEKGETLSFSQQGSFSIFICLKGNGTLTDDKGNQVTFRQGESILIPAENTTTVLHFEADSKLLETHID